MSCFDLGDYAQCVLRTKPQLTMLITQRPLRLTRNQLDASPSTTSEVMGRQVP